MCFPPICHPATHVLGCFGLRQGASGVLVLNALYGLCLVIVHALLLGEVDKEPVPPRHGSLRGMRGMPEGMERGHMEGTMPHEGPAIVPDNGVGWLVQLLDLDIGWGHRLFGFDDQSDLIAGLIYGVFIIVVCAYTFHQINSVRMGGECLNLATASRWFVAFMNLELLLYVGLVLVKLPILCKMQAEFMPNLTMECQVQRFMFLQRVVCNLVAASLGIWVFSSYSFSLTFGNVSMDQPEFADQLEMRDAAFTGKMPDLGPAPLGSMGRQSFAPPPYQTRQSLAPPPSAPRSLNAAPGRSQVGGRTSYHIGNMARAGSSMVSSTSGDPETQALIKPPLHVF